MEKILIERVQDRWIPPTIQNNGIVGSIGRAVERSIHDHQSWGLALKRDPSRTGILVHSIDQWQECVRNFVGSVRHWGFLVLAPMLGETGTSVDALGVASPDGYDAVIALRLIAEVHRVGHFEALELFFPEIHSFMVDDKTVVVVSNLNDFKRFCKQNQRTPGDYAPMFDAVTLGAIAHPHWFAHLELHSDPSEPFEEVAGAALSFNMFGIQLFPCSRAAWSKVFEDEIPKSRLRRFLCRWPGLNSRPSVFSSCQAAWISFSLQASAIAA